MEWRGRAIPLEGSFREVLDDLADVHRCGGRSRVQAWAVQRDAVAGYETVRVVGVRNEDADDYHLYVTNLSREEFFPADLAQIYRCRWEVELLFRELKTQYDLDEFDTSNEDVVKILLYAALLSLLVSRELLELVTEQAGDGSCFRRSAGRRPSGRTPSSSSTNSASISATRHRRCWSG